MNISNSNNFSPRTSDAVLSQITSILRLFDGGSDREIAQAATSAPNLPVEALEVIRRYQRGEMNRPAVREALNALYAARHQAAQLR